MFLVDWLLDLAPPRLLGDDQQEAGQDEVADHRGAAVGDEGQRDAGERYRLRSPADDDERLEGEHGSQAEGQELRGVVLGEQRDLGPPVDEREEGDRKSTRLNSSHANISYAVFCLKK